MKIQKLRSSEDLYFKTHKNNLSINTLIMKALRIILITLAVLATAFIGFKFFNTGKVLSPSATATFDKNGLKVNVDYCQPSKKDRLIFGEEKDKALVPFGKWWRTGANEATVIKFNKDVTIGGQPLKAGEYTLFTIPSATDWTIMINQDVGQWGLSYEPKNDILKAMASSAKVSSSQEMFQIDFKEQPDGTDMILSWDTTEVTIPIRTK
jgi:Protein of unknown function (DUF2911)